MKAYGSEPILFTTSPITPSPQASKKPQKKRLRMGAILVVIIIIAFIASGIFWLTSQKATSRIPQRFSAILAFQLYEPRWLPDGMDIDQQSFDATSQAFTFSISDKSGKRLVVTEQPKPSQNEIDEFYSGQLSGVSTFNTTVGQGTVGSFEGSELAGIVTEQTWILIRSATSGDREQLKQITTHFQPSK